MGSCYKFNRYCDEKLYDFREVVGKFSEYFNLDIEQMEEKFSTYSILSWKQIVEELIKYNLDMDSINRQKNTYLFYKKSLVNLGNKGIQLINLLKYLKDVVKITDYIEFYEKNLEEAGIFHFCYALTGDGINKILVVLLNILKEFDWYLENVNLIDTYLEKNKGIDEFALVYGGNSVYPNEKLVVYDTECDVNYLDKTSFVINGFSKIKKRRIN